MQFTPQQMAGFKGYGSGVLIGNWSEDLQVMEDKMALYQTIKSGTMSNANNAVALCAAMTEPAPIGPSCGDLVPFGVPLMIRSAATSGVLSVDITPKYSPRLNHVFVSLSPKATPQARNVWVLTKVPDENSDFYCTVGEEGVVHYGQKVKIVNESAGASGFYSLISSLQDTARSSGRQELAACLGGGNGTIFTVEPSGGPRGSKDGQPVKVSDCVVLIHKGSNAPVACEAHHRCNTSFGSEYEASCGMVKSQQTRAQSMVATQPGNFFSFVMLPAGSSWTPAPPATVTSALARVKSKILEKGGRLGFRALVVLFKQMDDSGDRRLSRNEFRSALEAFGVPLSSAELDAVFKVFDTNGDGVVSASEFARVFRGPMSARRERLVQDAFDRLNRDGVGDIDIDDLICVYSSNASLHPEATTVPHEQLVREFITAWGGYNGRITRTQFMDYYCDISAAIEHDDYFELMIRNAWRMSGGVGVTENTTARRVLVVFNDDTQRVVELKDDLGLKGTDTAGIMKKLASQGVTGVKRVELCA